MSTPVRPGASGPVRPGARAPVRPAVALALLLLAAFVAAVLPTAATAAPPTGTASVAGLVTDELGRPLLGVAVGVRLDGPAATGAEDEPRADVTTGSDGRYVAGGLPAATYALSFVLEGYEHGPDTGAVHGVVLTDGATTTADTFMIERSATVAGRVVDIGGAPVAGAEVTGSGSRLGTTDADGRFLARVVPGDYSFGVYATGFRARFDPGWTAVGTAGPWFSAERGETTTIPDVVMRREPTEACWAEDGTWWDRDPGTSSPRIPATPVRTPREDHLCPDVLASELPPAQVDTFFPSRPGIPKPPAVPRPAGSGTPAPGTAPAAPKVVAGVLRKAAKATVVAGRFAVRSTCATTCGGRVVATATVRSTPRAKPKTVVVGTATVAAGTGARNHRIVLNAVGRRLVRRARAGVVVTLRWDAPGTAKDRAGPRVRLTGR